MVAAFARRCSKTLGQHPTVVKFWGCHEEFQKEKADAETRLGGPLQLVEHAFDEAGFSAFLETCRAESQSMSRDNKQAKEDENGSCSGILWEIPLQEGEARSRSPQSIPKTGIPDGYQ